MASEIAVLRALRLKGRPTPADVAAVAGSPVDEVEDALRRAMDAGSAQELNGRYMLTPPGRDRLEALLEEERSSVDEDELRGMYEEFTELNSEFKEIVTSWQLRDGEPNDHSDAGYDAEIVARLAGLDERFRPLLERLVAEAPRLRPYPGRFAAALEKVQAGDHGWIARPIADSYHTVWFELHEDLIGLLGLSREAEAASGRAE